MNKIIENHLKNLKTDWKKHNLPVKAVLERVARLSLVAYTLGVRDGENKALKKFSSSKGRE